MFNSMWTKLSARMRRSTQVRAVRRFVRRQDGATAVEFGMVAAPFFALIFAILETALVLFSGQVLEFAVADSARLIMTGQAQQAGFSQQAFKDAVCAKIVGLFDCAGGVSIDVKSYTSFASISLAPPTVGPDGKFVDNFTFQPGAASEIVVVRLFYQWPVYVSLMGFSLENLSGGKRLLMATAAFRNEPFGATPPPP